MGEVTGIEHDGSTLRPTKPQAPQGLDRSTNLFPIKIMSYIHYAHNSRRSQNIWYLSWAGAGRGPGIDTYFKFKQAVNQASISS